jgi:hypothetical protein
VFIRVHLWFQQLLKVSTATRRRLAARAKMAAPASHDHALDFCVAAKTRLPIALVDAMAQLELAAFAFGIHVI